MFKYLKICSKQFSKRQSYTSVFDKLKIKDKYTTDTATKEDIKIDNLQYQNEKGLFDKVDHKQPIPEKVNFDRDLLVDEGLFVEVTKELKEELTTQDARHKGTNFGYLMSRFGTSIGERRKDLVEDINKLNHDSELLPRLKKLSDIGFSDEQIKLLLHKE
jgi:hypothetical protein